MTVADRDQPPAVPESYQSLWTALCRVAFRQGFVDAGGITTRFAEAGPPDGPAVVLLHGTGGHWETFARNLGPLAEHFHCIAFDMVGNGFSAKPDIDYEVPVYVAHAFAVMDAFGIHRASLAGTSLGSWVAAQMALDRPDRVDKLVLMSTAGLVGTAGNMARIRSQRTQAVDDPSWDNIKAMFDHLMADERNRLADLVALRQAIYRLPEMKQAIRHILVLQDPDVRARNLIPEERWRQIGAPTLVVASGKDFSEYESTSRRVAALIPDARLVDMPDVKHWPHFEDADEFNRVAIEFLRST
jgi:2-hydroxy-6-oxonona-2,4-dienedioate hydrolase